MHENQQYILYLLLKQVERCVKLQKWKWSVDTPVSLGGLQAKPISISDVAEL